jgi:hypothetical protein
VTVINVSQAIQSTATDTLDDVPGHLIGYARISTADQNPALQLDALETAGCDRVFTDRASGAVAERPELARALDHLRADDTLIVWKLDRLGRSLRHLIDTVHDLEQRGIGFAASRSRATRPRREAASSSTSSARWPSSNATSSASAPTPDSPPHEHAGAAAADPLS